MSIGSSFQIARGPVGVLDEPLGLLGGHLIGLLDETDDVLLFAAEHRGDHFHGEPSGVVKETG
jgi:hypothetical protein